MLDIDQVHINLSSDSMWYLKIILGLIMYGVALELKLLDFKNLLMAPKRLIAGIIGQYLMLPLLTYLVVLATSPKPSIALGMMLLASCPGGNLANYFTHLAKGNVALSVGLTSLSTVLSVFMTPFNIVFWSSRLPNVQMMLKEIHLDSSEMFSSVLIILGIPLVLGMLTAKYLPAFTLRAKKVLKIFSLICLVGFCVGAFSQNFKIFITYIDQVILLVLIHNAIIVLGAILLGKIMSLDWADTKAICSETSIQNSGLGLALIFQYFGGLGGMAFVAAWWAIWHMISGVGMVAAFNYFDKRRVQKGIVHV